MKFYPITLILILAVLTHGCSSKIAVMTLESTIQNAAEAAKRASREASETIKIEVSVANGYHAGAIVPVVPITVGTSTTVTTKLTIVVNLKKYSPPTSLLTQKEEIFTLDTKTGKLEKLNN